MRRLDQTTFVPFRPTSLFAVFAFAVAAASAVAQAPPSIRIETSREGVHRVSGRAIGAIRPLERVNPFNLRMTRDGVAVPIYVQGGADGRLDPVDDVLFYAVRPSTPHANTETYVLSESGATWFYKAGDPDPSLSPKEADGAVAVISAVWEERNVFDALDTMSTEILRGPARPFWWTASIEPGATIDRVFGAGQPPVRDVPAKLRVELFGATAPDVAQNVRIEVNGVQVSNASWNTPYEHVIETSIPGTALRPVNHVSIANLSKVKRVVEPGDDLGRPRQNRLLVKSVSLFYETRLATPPVVREQTVVEVVGSGAGTPRRYLIESRFVGGFTVFDPKGARMWRKTAFDVADAKSIPLAVVTPDGAYEPVEIAGMKPRRDGDAAEGDYVVITTSRFRRAVDPLVARRAQEGLKPVVYEAREIYDVFANGRGGPGAIRAFMKDAAARWKVKPKFLLLVGDADLDAVHLSEKETLPTNLVRTAYNGATGSDAPYGDVDDDGLPDVSVGRLPARTPEDLLEVVSRVMKGGAGAPSGSWRREAVFFAGEGRFGPAVDKMIESFAGSLISKEIPPDMRVSLTYGNPRSAWYWPAPNFNDAVIAAFNRGAALYNYVGHGSPRGFDRVDYEGKSYPILRTEDVPRLDNGGRAGLVSIIACSTGHFDDPKSDCVAERMFAKKGGPLAIFASSRVSHPFANALLGQGLVKALFKNRGATIGELLDDAKRRMVAEKSGMIATLAKPHLSKAVSIDDLVMDHVLLYNLIGDPASRLPLAAPLKSLDAPDAAAPGATIAVKATIEAGGGKARIALERARASLLGSKAADPANVDEVKRAHQAANDVVVVEIEGEVVDGSWSGDLTLPADLPEGSYVVSVYVEGANGAQDAAGARKLKVEAPPAK